MSRQRDYGPDQGMDVDTLTVTGRKYYIEQNEHKPLEDLLVWRELREDNIGKVSSHPQILKALERKQRLQEQRLPEPSSDMELVGDTFAGEMVQLDNVSAKCVYFHDSSYSPPLVPVQVGTMYNLASLVCVTPVGMIPLGNMPDDQIRIADSVVTLNPANIRFIRFELKEPSRDNSKRVSMLIPATDIMPTLLWSESLEESEPPTLCLFATDGMTMPAVTYRTDIVFGELTCGRNCECDQPDFTHPHQTIRIDPKIMTMEFLSALDNVHITGNLNIPVCPEERLIASRVSIPHVLSEPVCVLLDNLNSTLTEAAYGLFRLPFVYEINVQARTCTKMPINHVEVVKIETENGLHYLDTAIYNQFILPHEELLIQNMLFQMMFIYGKNGHAFLETCPSHKMLFDFYLRRNSGQVAFHYDTTPLFQVSTLSLLFSMPPGMVRPGPYIAPLPVFMSPDGTLIPADPESVGAPPGVCTFMVKRGTCVMANNYVVTHSTPGMKQLIGREVQDVPFMNFEVTRKFNFPYMEIPAQVQATLEESAKVPRSFLRMWHVNIKPETNPIYFGAAIPMCDQTVFSQILATCLGLQAEWFRTEKCVCIELTSAAPMALHSAIKGQVRGLMGGRQHPASTKSKSLRVVTTHSHKPTRSHSRASTISVTREKIKQKLGHLNRVCNNANQNVIFMRGPIRDRAHARTRSQSQSHKPRGSQTTRRAKSAP